MKAKVERQLIAEIESLRQEVAGLKREKAGRKEAEELYTTLANSSQISIYIIQNRKCQFANPKFCGYTGYSQDELGRMDLLALVHPEDREMVRENAVKMLKGERFSPYEFRSITKGGELRWIMETVIPIHYRGERAALGSYMDITERKQAVEALQESEEKYKATFEHTGSAMAILEEDTTISLTNSHLEQMTGYPKEEIKGTRWTKFIHPDDLKIMLGYHKERRVVTEEVPTEYEFRVLRKNGDIRDAIIEVNMIPGTKKSVISLIDITERKRMEDTLRERERFLFGTLNDMLTFVAVLEPDGRVIFVNNTPLEVAGIKQEEVIGTMFYDAYWWAYSEEAKQMIKEDITACASGKILTRQIECQKADGKLIWIEFSIHPIYDAEGKVKYVVPEGRDITERKKSEENLRESEERYRSLFENSIEGVFIVDIAGNFTSANKATEELFGYSREELIGMSYKKLHSPETAEASFRETNKLFRTGEPTPNFVREFIKKDGERCLIEGYANLLKKEGKIVGFQGTLRDITEHKRAEESLKESEERYRSLFENSIEGVFIVDIAGNFTSANKATEELFGYSREELIGMSYKKLHSPETAEASFRETNKLFRTGEPTPNFVREFIKKDGERCLIEGYANLLKKEGKIVGFQGTLRDITSRKQVEEALEHSFIDLAETISRAMASRDPYTAGHEQRVAELARLVGEKMGLDGNRLMGLYIGGLLHDIGKISTPETILTKPGKLSNEEWALVQAHARQGYGIVDGANFPWPVADMTLHHHERLDGSGYPHGISGDEISLENRILGVCDVVEAMSSHRPYRPARSKEEVLAEIKGGRGTKYDASVIDVMLQIIENGEFDFGWRVEV